jgi:23S rRNA pseudouridine2604 synthase
MAWTRLYDEAEPQRVNRWLAQNGVCSRREAEALISQGLVSIDGQRVDDVGRKIEPGQTLVLSDRAQAQLEGALTVMIHKPIGIVSAQPDTGQVPAVRLLTREALFGQSPVIPGFSNNLAPVGRLDMDSRGLLILSEDGVVAKAVIGPASDMEKEYLVWVDGWITDEKLAAPRPGRGRGPPAAEVHSQGRPQPPDPPDVRAGRADRRGPAAHPHRRAGPGRPAGRSLAAADDRRTKQPDHPRRLSRRC